MINRGDIKKMLRHLGVDAEGDLVADLWAVLDQDKNNKITFEEFAPVYVNWYRYGLRQEQKLMLKPEELRQVHALFDRLDVSRTGWLSQAEMHALNPNPNPNPNPTPTPTPTPSPDPSPNPNPGIGRRGRLWCLSSRPRCTGESRP